MGDARDPAEATELIAQDEVAETRRLRRHQRLQALAEVRRREFYEKPTWVRKRKAAAAVKRHQKKLARENRRQQRMF